MYEFSLINRNLICVSQLLKGGSFPTHTMDYMRDMVRGNQESLRLPSPDKYLLGVISQQSSDPKMNYQSSW
jgi:hypothetical protein